MLQCSGVDAAISFVGRFNDRASRIEDLVVFPDLKNGMLHVPYKV